jgi:glyoxylase-like metal-dependent hydrolase (beta-lactamase superfamily II)/rhodanese-related sulfurtransferase
VYFKQIVVPGLGCLSYVVGCTAAGVAAVVDPKRDVKDYLDIARTEGLRITHIIETHVHADHVSGNLELQSYTGADIYFYEGSPVTFPHKTLKEGDTITLGAAELKVIATPGHTPHSLSLLAADTARSRDPWLLLTGDLLFVGDIGRPDLAGDESLEDQVKNLYVSLTEKLGRLPERVEVFPAHGQGSLCGKGMSFKSSSTLGFERLSNPMLRMGFDAFRQAHLGEFPERPKSFSHIIAVNMKGAPLLERCPLQRALTPAQFEAAMNRGAVVVDTRDTAAFGGVHVPGSINIGFEKQTANWVGMVIDPESDIVLVVSDEAAYHAICLELHRIGYDNILGYLDGGISAWQLAGFSIDRLSQIAPAELNAKLATGDYQHVFDVRTPAEWKSGHVREASHYPLTRMLAQPPDVPRDDEIVVMCGVGYRGNIAASFLQQHGFSHVHSLAGGMVGWKNAGFPVTT